MFIVGSKSKIHNNLSEEFIDLIKLHMSDYDDGLYNNPFLGHLMLRNMKSVHIIDSFILCLDFFVLEEFDEFTQLFILPFETKAEIMCWLLQQEKIDDIIFIFGDFTENNLYRCFFELSLIGIAFKELYLAPECDSTILDKMEQRVNFILENKILRKI